MRGVAALLVFVIHTLIAHTGMGFDQVYPIFWWVGPSGVDIFFVISGFVVTTSAVRHGLAKAGSFEIAWKFALKRVVRIYPVYWSLFAVALLIVPPVKSATDGFPQRPFFEKLFLLTPFNDYIMLSWSLCFEMWFYLVLTCILLVLPRRVYAGLLAWGVVSLAFVAYGYLYVPAWGWMVAASPLLIEFMLGCVVAWLIDRGVRRRGWTTLFAGLAWYCVAIYLNMRFGAYDVHWRPPLFGAGAALVIYGLIALELTNRYTLPKFMLPVGSASYSIYLWHQFTLFTLVWVSEHFGLFGVVPGPLLLFIWACIAMGMGFLSYRLIEKPSMAWLDISLSARRRKAGGEISITSAPTGAT
jgi:exopolysaccharide production protein ExoZ